VQIRFSSISAIAAAVRSELQAGIDVDFIAWL
jgi:hypothetical protein